MKEQLLLSIPSKIKYYLLLLPLLFIGLFCLPEKAYSQDVSWTLLSDSDGIKVYYGFSSCGSDQVISLKIENTGLSAASVHLMLEAQEGTRLMPYPILMSHLQAGEAEVLDCQNLGRTPAFLPFPVEQPDQVQMVIKKIAVNRS